MLQLNRYKIHYEESEKEITWVFFLKSNRLCYTGIRQNPCLPPPLKNKSRLYRLPNLC